MALRKLGSSTSESTDVKDLPWGNQYAKEVQDFSIMYFVHKVIEYDTGLQIACDQFKVYAHVGTSLHKELLEAVQTFVDSGIAVHVLVMQLHPKGKYDLFVNDELPTNKWIKNENRYVQVKNNLDKRKGKEVNRFLAGMGVLEARASEGVVDDISAAKAHRAAARRAAKEG